MGVTFLARRPDSGLGNIRSSPGDPARNVDWVLLLTQGALTVIGCFIVFSASRTRIVDDPLRVRHPPGRVRASSPAS